MVDYKALNSLISDYFDDYEKDNYLFENLLMIGRVCKNIQKKEIKIVKKEVELDNLKTLSLASEFFLSIHKNYSSTFEVMVKDTKINFCEKEEDKIVNAMNIKSNETMDDLFILVDTFLKQEEKNPLKYFISLNLLPIFFFFFFYKSEEINYYVLEKQKNLKKLLPLIIYFSLLFEIYLNYFKINERSVDKMIVKDEDKKEFIKMSEYFLSHHDVIHMESVIAFVFDQILALVIAQKLNEKESYYKAYQNIGRNTDYEKIFREFEINEENMDTLYKKRISEMLNIQVDE